MESTIKYFLRNFNIKIFFWYFQSIHLNLQFPKISPSWKKRTTDGENYRVQNFFTIGICTTNETAFYGGFGTSLLVEINNQ